MSFPKKLKLNFIKCMPSDMRHKQLGCEWMVCIFIGSITDTLGVRE